MNHFSYYLRHIDISKHKLLHTFRFPITYLKNTPFGSNSKACYDLKETNSKIIKQRFKQVSTFFANFWWMRSRLK